MRLVANEVHGINLEPMTSKINDKEAAKEESMKHFFLFIFYMSQSQLKHSENQRFCREPIY